MNLFILQQLNFTKSMFQHEDLLDVMIACEDFIDICGAYSFLNWDKGEVCGCKVFKYFVNIMLKYPYEDMPDPKAVKIFESYGCKVIFKEMYDYKPMQKVEDEEETYVDDKTKTRKNKIKREKIWFVDIMIPRKYIENKDLFDLDAVEEYLEQEKDSENE